MKTIQSLILLSLFLCATSSVNAMQGEIDEPIITLCSIKNSIASPDTAGRIECLVNGKEAGIIHSCHSSILNKVLFTRKDTTPTIKRLNLELRHPRQDGFKELRLKLNFDGSHLGIVKDLSDKVQRPQEFYPLEDGKKYLLNIHVDNDNQVSAELVEDNN